MKWFKSYSASLIFQNSKILKYKKLSYKFDDNEFYFDDLKIHLTKKSKFILFQLLISPEKLISESSLKDKLW
jgi:DNA-binding response OmpR family regulator